VPRSPPACGRCSTPRRKGPDGEDHGPEHYAFGNEVGERIKRVRHAWDNTCERAGIEDLHLHDLRRDQGSQLEESGAHLHEVEEWLGCERGDDVALPEDERPAPAEGRAEVRGPEN
jgi:integrase